jgi:hypothetical protein
MRKFTFLCAVRGGPGEIRGKQMAERLGGRFNPGGTYEDGVCVYVLGTSIDPVHLPEYAYHDVLDCGWRRIGRVRRMKGDLIAVSKAQYPVLKEFFPGRRVFLIQQHHCNFRRERRPDRPVLRVGTIGGDSSFQWPHYAMERMFKDYGMEWVYGYKYTNRGAVLEFYRGIDVQVCWRPTHARGLQLHMNVLKLANAGSFGIPTVSYPEPAYTAEWKYECTYAETIYDLVLKVHELKTNPDVYAHVSDLSRARAEEYHIDKIGKLYESLPGVEE